MSAQSLHLCYYHKQHDDLQFGVEWETNGPMQESVATLAYHIELDHTATVRGSCPFVIYKGVNKCDAPAAMADSQWTIGCTVEKKLAPLPFTLALSAMFNHVKQQSKVGLGLIIGGP